MTLRRKRHSAAPLLFGAALLLSVGVDAQNYLTDIGPNAPALGINNSGQVVLQNYLYSNSTLTAFPPDFTGAAINDSGEVVGSVSAGPICTNVGLDAGLDCAFGSYTSGVLTTYPIYNKALDADNGNQAWGINDSGDIVGDWVMVHGQGGAVEYSNGTFSDVYFSGQSGCSGDLVVQAGVAYGINNAGQIAAMLPYDPTHTGESCTAYAFLVNQGVYTPIGIGGALAINASAAVVGYIQFGPTQAQGNAPLHAFLYNAAVSSAPKDLGTLLPSDTNSYAYAINAGNFAVGDSGSAPFYYNGAMQNLNALVNSNDPLKPFVTLTDARGINDAGAVVANGVDSRTPSAQHAYILQVPLLQIAPGPLTFASQALGTTSAPQTATFTNAGTAQITLGGVSISSDFVLLANSCGSSLSPAGQCSVTVAYAPTVAGNPMGSAALTAGGVPIAVPLLGSSPLSASIKVSATSTTVSHSVTLTWTATAGASCTATGATGLNNNWTGAIPTSGSRAVAESIPGSYVYGISCSAGAQTQNAQTAPVVVTWPAVTVSLTASPTTLMTGSATTLTWTSKNATSCATSGGGSNDAWPSSSRPTSGSVSITEPNPVVTGQSETLTFTITCTSSASKLSASSSAEVTQLDNPAKSGSSGGGALDFSYLILLSALLTFRQLSQRRMH